MSLLNHYLPGLTWRVRITNLIRRILAYFGWIVLSHREYTGMKEVLERAEKELRELNP